MESIKKGLLKVRVKRGIKLAVRDALSSDPYVVVRTGTQKVKTKTVKRNCNPEWNDELTLCITNPSIPIKLTVYDRDRFSRHDKMGQAAIDIKPYLECLEQMTSTSEDETPVGAIVKTIDPDLDNCLAEESKVISIGKGKMVQDMVLKLQNVERGIVVIQIEWINLVDGACSGL